MDTLPLVGRVAVITGASQGLGLEIAKAYAQAGASVVLCARDAETLARARDEVAAMAARTQSVVAVAADVSSPPDVDRLTRSALEVSGRVHVLVSNAGVYGPMGSVEDVDWLEWTRTIEINVYGSVLPARALLPHFKAQRYGKIVQLSGGGATSPLPRISAYAASKAAIVRFVETLAAEVRAFHIDVNAIAPGVLNTRMLDEAIAAGPGRVGSEYYERMVRTKAEGGAPLARAAALAVLFGSAASDGITGRLVSAVWDPWESLASRRDDLDSTDIYTLRRIVPKDRGRDWDER
jgi:NAD(P)-dependent dehydrogenase (short-subunit alcohol dehydrogenase family)